MKTSGLSLVSHLPMHMHNSHLTHLTKAGLSVLSIKVWQQSHYNFHLCISNNTKTMHGDRRQKSNRKLNIKMADYLADSNTNAQLCWQSMRKMRFCSVKDIQWFQCYHSKKETIRHKWRSL